MCVCVCVYVYIHIHIKMYIYIYICMCIHICCSCIIDCSKSLQSCLTLCDNMESSLPGSSVHSPGKNTGVGCHFLLQGIFQNQGSSSIHSKLN